MPPELTPYAILAGFAATIGSVLVAWLRAIGSGRLVPGHLVERMRTDLQDRIADKDATIAALQAANDKLAAGVERLSEVGETSNDLMRALSESARREGRR